MSSKVYEMVTEQIIEQLERVDPNDFKKSWFAVGHSPVNLRGTSYRGINHLLLSGAEHASNIWATYKQWAEAGCQVRKAEKSQIVVLWKFFDEDDEKATRKNRRVMMRYYRVFNSGQVDGDAARQAEQRFRDKLRDHDPIEEAERFVGAYLEHESIPLVRSDRAYFRPGPDERIAMPELGQFETPEHYYSVFAHEIAHSTGTASRLGRDLSGTHGSSGYAFEELVAEFGAAMICANLGLERRPRVDHAQYIKGWLQALRDDARLAVRAASQAQKAADHALASAGLLVAEAAA